MLEEKREEIPEEFGIKLVDLAVSEMTRDKVFLPSLLLSQSAIIDLKEREDIEVLTYY